MRLAWDSVAASFLIEQITLESCSLRSPSTMAQLQFMMNYSKIATAKSPKEDSNTKSEIFNTHNDKDVTNNCQNRHLEQPLIPLGENINPAVGRDSEDRDDMTCRICLEDDNRDCMIAPCQCNGSSKWVHRHCLDQWRVNQEDRAFSKCTECLFEYRMELNSTNSDRRRRIKYCIYVTRDIISFTLFVQVVIGLLGWFARLADVAEEIPYQWMGCQYDMMDGTAVESDGDGAAGNETLLRSGQRNSVTFSTDPYSPFCYFSTYYLTGLMLFLIALGLYGSIVLCQNRCSVHDAMHHHDRTETASVSTIARTNQAPRREAISSTTRGGRAGSPNPRRHPYDCGDCYCIDCGAGCSDCHCCSCDCDCNHDGGSDSGAHMLLLILAMIAIVLAMIGAVVGFLIAVSVTQRAIQRHLFLLQKRRLVSEYRVMDLSQYNNISNFRNDRSYQDRDSTLRNDCIISYDVDDDSYVELLSDDVERNHWSTRHVATEASEIPLPPPILPEADVSHLKKLGLME